jgi:hypothetical protein
MSISVNLNVSGGEEFAEAIRRFDGAIQNRIQEQLLEWAESVRIDAQRLVPIRTGYLQSTIYAKSKNWQVEVGAEATYAAAVEFGTHNSHAHPYLVPAVETYLPNLERVMLQAIDSAKTEAQL